MFPCSELLLTLPVPLQRMVKRNFPGMGSVEIRLQKSGQITMSNDYYYVNSFVLKVWGLKEEDDKMIFPSLLPVFSSLIYDENLKQVRLSQDKEKSWVECLNRIENELDEVIQVYDKLGKPLPSIYWDIKKELEEVRSFFEQLLTSVMLHVDLAEYILALRSEIAFTPNNPDLIFHKLGSFLFNMYNDGEWDVDPNYCPEELKFILHLIFIGLSLNVLTIWFNWMLNYVVKKNWFNRYLSKTYLATLLVEGLNILINAAVYIWVFLPVYTLVCFSGLTFYLL